MNHLKEQSEMIRISVTQPVDEWIWMNQNLISNLNKIVSVQMNKSVNKANESFN